MKKSTQYITLSLLAASLASCRQTRHRHPASQDWSNGRDDRDNYYMDYGYGYAPMNYYYPFWYYNSCGYYGGHICNNTAVLYHSNGGYRATSGGRVSHADIAGNGRVTTSRGGFGSSSHSFSSGGHGAGE